MSKHHDQTSHATKPSPIQPTEANNNPFRLFRFGLTLSFSHNELAEAHLEGGRDVSTIEGADHAATTFRETQPGIYRYLYYSDNSPLHKENAATCAIARRLCIAVRNRFGRVPVLDEEMLRETDALAREYLVDPAALERVEKIGLVGYVQQTFREYSTKRLLPEPDKVRVAARILTLLTCFALRLIRDDASTDQLKADLPEDWPAAGQPEGAQSRSDSRPGSVISYPVPFLKFSKDEWNHACSEADRDSNAPEAADRSTKAFEAAQPGIAKFLACDDGSPSVDMNRQIIRFAQRFCIAIRNRYGSAAVLDEQRLRSGEAYIKEHKLGTPNAFDSAQNDQSVRQADKLVRQHLAQTGEEPYPNRLGFVSRVMALVACFSIAIVEDDLDRISRRLTGPL